MTGTHKISSPTIFVCSAESGAMGRVILLAFIESAPGTVVPASGDFFVLFHPFACHGSDTSRGLKAVPI